MADIATVEEVKAYARDETSTLNYEFIEQALNAAEAEINNGCARRFVVAGATATARVYAPESHELVRIHDCTEITSVVSSGSTVSASSYQLEPLNGLTAAGLAVPYDRIRLLSGSWDTGSSNRREATITVTAKWGWAAIPAQIKQACLVLAKDVLSNRDVRFGLVAVTDAAGISARTNSVVRAAIEQHARVEAWGIG